MLLLHHDAQELLACPSLDWRHDDDYDDDDDVVEHDVRGWTGVFDLKI